MRPGRGRAAGPADGAAERRRPGTLVLAACGDTSARAAQRAYFQLRDPYAREALHGEAARELEALQAPLSYLLTGLSRRAMTVEPQRRQSLFGPRRGPS